MYKLTIFFKKTIFLFLDVLLKKREDYWIIPCHYIQTETLKDNPRAIFEHIKNDPEIKKIIVFRGKKLDSNISPSLNTEIVKQGTSKFFYLLAKSKVVFLSNSISLDYSFRYGEGKFSILKISSKKRVVVNLWHGIPFKGLFYTANQNVRAQHDRFKYRIKERAGYAGLIASSNIDSYAMAASFYPLSYDKVWTTGLPRNDFLKMPDSKLPSYLKNHVEKIKKIKGDKKLIVYAPTYRQKTAKEKFYNFSEEEINLLKKLLKDNNAILGFRPHYFVSDESKCRLHASIDNEVFYDFSLNCYEEFSPIAREFDILITDYSSVFMDALYLDKPTIGFMYDYDSYTKEHDGLLYTIEQAFPGTATKKFGDLLSTLEETLKSSSTSKYESQKRLFYKYIDDSNSSRVVEQVKCALKRL